MNRRELVKLGAAQAAMVAVPVTGGMVAQAAAKSGSSSNAKTLTLSNAQFELSVTPGAGCSAGWSIALRARSWQTAPTPIPSELRFFPKCRQDG